jgi:two-component system cell cycle sensor histidine kinase/response regulator CckA
MDDEPVIRDAVSEMLKSLGYSVIATQNGREAIDVARRETQAGRRIEAMILDMTVPGGMGGREAVGEIRRINPRLPVFVASGYAEDPVVAAPKDHGFVGSICKPFTRSDLAEMLRKSKEE